MTIFCPFSKGDVVSPSSHISPWCHYDFLLFLEDSCQWCKHRFAYRSHFLTNFNKCMSVEFFNLTFSPTNPFFRGRLMFHLWGVFLRWQVFMNQLLHNVCRDLSPCADFFLPLIDFFSRNHLPYHCNTA